MATSGTKPGVPRWEFDVTAIMPPIIAVLEIVAMCYLAIWAENSVKFELQS